MEKEKRLCRFIYLTGFVALLILEILIGIYVDDRFIRPYGGDILVVILLGCLYRSIRPLGRLWLSGGIFVLALGVEIAQHFNFVDLIGLGHIRFFRILMGTSFSWADILSYGAGCVIFFLMDWLLQRKQAPQS
jgi:hypothetical protein